MGLCSNDVKSSYIAFHEHFNYIVMHFICVLYMLSRCVLLGLDWVELMMYLSLHVTCSYIFIHTYLHFFRFLYTAVIGTFLTLSLSLFLALVCSMASKRKSTPSQNPLRSRASSFSNPTPSSVRFCDDKARKDFLENFCKRGIHLECHVVLSNFSDIDPPIVIHSRGWESLCDIPITCPSMIIQEFYSNMHGIDTIVPHFFSRIRGTRIVVTLKIVFKVLHVPRVAHLDYPGCECLRTVSKDELSSRFCETPSSWGDH